MPVNWQTVRIFISSTFRDMHAERDHLVKVTFPRLRQWCENRRLHLDEIDLRWGITQEQAINGKVIELCLQTIDGSRPFFVSMIGNRYGQTPGEMPPDQVLKMRGFEVATDKSVTHLEILYAALWPNSQPEKPPCEYSFFYFRDPSCIPNPASLTNYTPEQLSLHEATFFTTDPIRAQMLADLKREIRQKFEPLGRVFEYTGQWKSDADNPEDEALRGRLTALESFGEKVESDLKKAIENRFPQRMGDVGRDDPLSEERAYHEAFIESRMRRTGSNDSVYVPLSEIEMQVDAYVYGYSSAPLVLTGGPGSGKSASLAHWSQKYEATGDFFVLARFIGASPSSTNLDRLLANLCDELNQHFNLGLVVPRDPRELRIKWPEILQQAAERGRVLILIDGLNQLDRGADLDVGDWLPRALPAGIRLVASALHDDPFTDAIRSRGQPKDRSLLSILSEMGCTIVPVRPLTGEEQRRILTHVPSLHAKTLETEQIELLLSNPGTRNPLFLLVALEELRTFGSYEKLNSAIQSLPRPEQTEAGIQKVVEQMFERVLARLERESNRTVPGLASELFSLLASAREGLSEEELRALLRGKFSALPDQLCEGQFQILLRQVRSYLLRKGSQHAALVDFYHRSFWKAARNRYIASAASRRQRHSQLAAHFEKLSAQIDGVPNERKAAELIWNLLQALKASSESGEPPHSGWQPLEQVLLDQTFLEAKCSLGLGYELLEEFDEAYQALGQHRRDLAPKAIKSLVDLFFAHYGQNHPFLTLVTIQSFFAYRTGDKEFYEAFLQLPDSPAWLQQAPDAAAGEKFALEAAVDYCGLLRRKGEVAEAESRLRSIVGRLEEVGHLPALCRGEYELAYIYFLRHEFDDAARICERSAEHSFQAGHPLGGWGSRCLQFRASYLGARTSCAHEFQARLQEAQEAFEARSDSDFGRRWIMNCNAHLFEIAFAQEDASSAGELLEQIERSHWMQERGDNDRSLRILPYKARLAMLENRWQFAIACFEKYLDVPNPVWNCKSGEALSREYLDYGIAVAESQSMGNARQVWQRGLACPDDLANKIWKRRINEAQRLLDIYGRCWPHLARPLLR